MPPQPTVFISYNHKDEKEKDALLSHLGVLQHTGLIDVWSDDRIRAGSDWEEEISQAISQARVAILLISANFLNSDFILSQEVPRLLERRKREGLIVFPVIAKWCAWQKVTWLAKMNVRPKNKRPVWSDDGSHMDRDLAAIAEEIADIIEKESRTSEPESKISVASPPKSPTQTIASKSGEGKKELQPTKKVPTKFGLNWEKIGAIAGVVSMIIAIVALGISPDLRESILSRATEIAVATPDITATNTVVTTPNTTPIAVVTPNLVEPTHEPTVEPTEELISNPSPTEEPTIEPTTEPSVEPTTEPTTEPQPTDMVKIPAGPFLMGSLQDSSGLPGLDHDPQPEPDEFPQHTVFLSEFWIDRTEVTNASYRECVNAEVCAHQSGGDFNYHNNPTFDNFPTVFVSWDDAKAYCEWVGKRLPTEAEWEKASRGTDGRIWPWGNTLKDDPSKPVERANVGDGMANQLTEVGAYPNGASPFGALNMTGNVWEWVNDWYSAAYYAQRPDPDTSPLGPTENESDGRKVIRGGSFGTIGINARTAERNAVNPGPSFDIGFRCAKSVE